MSVAEFLARGRPARDCALGDQVYAHLRRLLIAGWLAPGDKLSLRAVAMAMGVSMTPAREAVTRLVADGALEVTPNRAVRVPVMKAREFQQLATVRAQIEGFAAAQAALGRGPEALAAIARAEARFRSLAQASVPDLPAVVEANQAFHFAVYEASGLPVLVEIVVGLWLKAGPVINLDLRENPERLVTGAAPRLHAAALEAIRAGDPDAARQAIADDIAGAAAFILSRGRLGV